MKRWLWIGGWALPVEWQSRLLKKYWPDFSHDVLTPNELCMAEFVQRMDSGDYVRLGGYSLGSLLLLRSLHSEPPLPTLLLAPILDFKSESALGGRMRRGHLGALEMQLRQDPLVAVNDFYQRAGLNVDKAKTLPYKVEDLRWGIQQLREAAAIHWRYAQIQAFVGEGDLLLNAAILQQQWPEVVILPGVGHDLSDLLLEAAA